MSHTIHIQKLGALANIKSGYLFKGALPVDPAGDVTVLQIRDLKVHEAIDWHKCLHVPKGRMMDEARLRQDMLIFSAKGTRNFAWHIDEDPKFAIVNSLFHVINVRSEVIDPAFLAWQINQSKAQAWLDNASAGVTVQNIKISALKELPIIIPPIEEQKKVITYERAALAEKRALTSLIENREKEIRAIAATILSGTPK